MAEFVEIMNLRGRMCKRNGLCYDCELSSRNNGKGITCVNFTLDYPEEAEKIIVDWTKKHPAKTNADKFKEVFGVNINHSSSKCRGIDCAEIESCDECKYKGFWEQEYKAPQEENQ